MLLQAVQRYDLNPGSENVASRTLHRTLQLKELLTCLAPEELCEIIYIDAPGELPNAHSIKPAEGKRVILIGREIFDTCSEAELRFVIAHELAHLKLGHLPDPDSKETTEDEIEAIISNEIASHRPTAKWSRRWIALRDWALSPLGRWFQKQALKESREHEFEADAFAVNLLQEKGLDSSGAASFFKKLRRIEYPAGACNINEEDRIRLQNTHPFAYERLNRVVSGQYQVAM